MALSLDVTYRGLKNRYGEPGDEDSGMPVKVTSKSLTVEPDPVSVCLWRGAWR